jgi:selenobiotic family peptide radical SAM maturase
MHTSLPNNLDDIFPRCRAALGDVPWNALAAAAASGQGPKAFLEAVRSEGGDAMPGYLPDLARLEWSLFTVRNNAAALSDSVSRTMVNPTVQVLDLAWTGLTAVPDTPDAPLSPSSGRERVLVWIEPRSRTVRARPATDEDLLILKMVLEDIPPESVASTGNVPIGAVDAALDRAVRSGLLLTPASRILRDPDVFSAMGRNESEFLSSPSFTLQWHITQACDLRCRHCYDRSDRSPLTYEDAVRVLDDLRAFCRDRNVQGAVSFTGGNPLLHPRFNDIYRAALDRNLSTAILGNPATRERIEEIVRIGMPSFFQVSLEGLREHNDSIRGPGHFDRIMNFLDVLRALQISSMVMLTLTSENLDQVIPLAELLRDRTDVFHFNRLALFGEGANLKMADRARYRRFLEDYLKAAESNPVMGTKDNLINILLHERGADLFGGCTGYGCGAAFNFVTLLADGEVHACRKLPSPIGNIHEHTLAELYDSGVAKRYRRGPSACNGCEVRVACGGCLASTGSSGLDIFTEKDPFCFRSSDQKSGGSQDPEELLS